jgi:PD-(D/E)XK nuclease superfamily
LSSPSDTARRWSFSALEDYTSCGQKFYLKRVARVPAVVYLNAVAGTAFHEWSAYYDRSHISPRDWPEYLHRAIETERSGTALEDMRVSGKRTQATPNKEDYTHWRDVLGPDLCAKYIEWVKDKRIAWDLPPDAAGNTTGIEYELNFTIGETKVKSFVDRLFTYSDDSLLVVDIKAGARKQTTVQLPTYVIGAKKAGLNVRHGSLYYARRGTHTEPEDYSKWDEHRLSYLYEQAAEMEAQGFYLPRPSEDCRWCSVAAHCRFALA